MNALATRDALFSELHTAVLKPGGFRKKGHWSILENSPLIRTVYLRSSRWSEANSVTFWIDIQVFHQGWLALVYGPKPFPGPTEGTPSLLTEELGLMCEVPVHTFKIDQNTDTDSLKSDILNAMKNHGLALLKQCSSLEGILDYYTKKHNPARHAFAAAGIYLLLGKHEEAKLQMQMAKDASTHENTTRWLEMRERAMWSNSSIKA